MKRFLFLAVAAALAYGLAQERGISIPGLPLHTQSADSTLQAAYHNRQSGIQVQGEGIVSKVLRDDLEGARHQKFILRLPAGQTLLIAHNIDLAPRISGLREGDTVAFYGEYEWNARGGVVHWTHRDPGGRHPDGWLKYAGRTYQ